MNQHNSQTLDFLTQIGMDVDYPVIHHAYIVSKDVYSAVDNHPPSIGTRSAINQIPEVKFTMVFLVLDHFIDEKYGFVDQQFAAKYRNIPNSITYDKILRELYRVAKFIRNVLIHDQSKFARTNTHIEIKDPNDTNKLLFKMSHEALGCFYTAVVMYVRGNLGTGPYFEAAVSTLYSEIKKGVEIIEDKNGPLLNPVEDVSYKVNLTWRRILKDPEFSFDPYLTVHIDTSKAYLSSHQGLDYAFIHQGKKILIPVEALKAGLQINENQALNEWEYQGPFPPFDPIMTGN